MVFFGEREWPREGGTYTLCFLCREGFMRVLFVGESFRGMKVVACGFKVDETGVSAGPSPVMPPRKDGLVYRCAGCVVAD